MSFILQRHPSYKKYKTALSAITVFYGRRKCLVYFAVCCAHRIVFDLFFFFSPLSIVLEETLLDDLLNFATTPKGLLLLQNTGMVTECVTFMFNRFMKNLQVGILILKKKYLEQKLIKTIISLTQIT